MQNSKSKYEKMAVLRLIFLLQCIFLVNIQCDNDFRENLDELYRPQIWCLVNYLNTNPDRPYNYNYGTLISAQNKDIDNTDLTIDVEVECRNPNIRCTQNILECTGTVRYNTDTANYEVIPGAACNQKPQLETTVSDDVSESQSEEYRSEPPQDEELHAEVADNVETYSNSPEPVYEQPFVKMTARPLGAPIDLNQNIEGLNILTDIALKHIESERDFKPALVRIIRVQRQIVSGVKYILLLEIAQTNCLKNNQQSSSEICAVENNANPEICEVTYYQQPWISRKKNIVSNNCTQTQEFTAYDDQNSSTNDQDNEIDTNYNPKKPSGYPVDHIETGETLPNYDVIADNGNAEDILKMTGGTVMDPARLRDLESQIVFMQAKEEATTIMPSTTEEESALTDEQKSAVDDLLGMMGDEIRKKRSTKNDNNDNDSSSSSSSSSSDEDDKEQEKTKRKSKKYRKQDKNDNDDDNDDDNNNDNNNNNNDKNNDDSSSSSSSSSEENNDNDDEKKHKSKKTKRQAPPDSSESSEDVEIRQRRAVDSSSSSSSSEENNPTPAVLNKKDNKADSSSSSEENNEDNRTKRETNPKDNTSESSEEKTGTKNETKIGKDTSEEHSSEEHRGGVRRKRSLSSNNELIKISPEEKNFVNNLADFSASTLDDIDADNHKRVVLQLLGAKKTTDGNLYHLTIRVGISLCPEEVNPIIDLNKENRPDKCRNKLFENLTKICKVQIRLDDDKTNPKVEKSHCQNIKKDQDDTQINRTNRSKRGSDKLVGGINNVSPEDEEIQKYAKQVLLDLNAQEGGSKTREYVKVISASKQVVSGILYRIKLELQENGVKKICNLEVWDQPWIPQGKEVKIKCDGDNAKKTYRFKRSYRFGPGAFGKDDHDVHVGMFKDFMHKHKKSYESKTEFKKRFLIFRENMKTIKMLNDNEQGTAKYGPTMFADLTRDEYRQYLGLNPELHNPNNIPLPQATIPKIELPTEFDWRSKGVISEVKNQGQCGSCWAFSVTGNIEGINAIKTGNLIELSEQELVDCDLLDQGCNGGLPDNAYRAIEQIGGLETETDYPYEAENEKCNFNKSLTRVQISGAVNISSNEIDMAKWLTKNGPISIGINANAMQFYYGGVSHPFKFLCNPNNLDHGVLIVGYGVHKYPLFNKVLPYWIVKNSWGPTWGEQGYYRVYRGDGTCGINKMASSAIL